MSTAMMPITTSSSTNVNAPRRAILDLCIPMVAPSAKTTNDLNALVSSRRAAGRPVLRVAHLDRFHAFGDRRERGDVAVAVQDVVFHLALGVVVGVAVAQ